MIYLAPKNWLFFAFVWIHAKLFRILNRMFRIWVLELGSLTRNKHKVWKICCSFIVFQQVIVFEEAEADFKIHFEDSPDLGMTVDI